MYALRLYEIKTVNPVFEKSKFLLIKVPISVVDKRLILI